MSQFVFKLEGVLRHRQRIEKDRQRELAIAQSEVVKLEQQLKALDDVRRSTSDVRDHHLVGRLDINYLAAHRRYMLGMQRKVIGLVQQIEQKNGAMDVLRASLAEATKQRKMIEKLREKHHQRWAADAARREANDLDELTTRLSFGRPGPGEDDLP